MRIKFKTKEDRIKGFYELATKGMGKSLPNGIFEISDQYLQLLDEANVAYEIISKRAMLINKKNAKRHSHYEERSDEAISST